MGQGKAWMSPAAPKRDGTTLVTLPINHLRDAHELVGMEIEGYTPITLVPSRSRDRCCCMPCCWVSVPSGFGAMVSRFGAEVEGNGEDKTFSPGGKCFMPWWRVDRLVTRQLVIFDTPIKECRTKDHIVVTIDVLIVFEIKDAVKFTYGLGPEKLDDLLRASQEEVLRDLASKTEVESINDLRGSATEGYVEQMNKQFEEFGVMIHHFTVKNVEMPSDMAQDFEDKTLFTSKTKETEMKLNFDKQRLNHEEARAKLKEECDNAKMAQEEQAVTAKAQLTKEVRELEASTAKDIAILDAEIEAEVQAIVAQSELELAKTAAEQRQNKLEMETKVNVEVESLEAKTEMYVRERKSKSKMEGAAKACEGKKALAEAEGASASAFAARRAYEQEMKRLDVLESLTKCKDLTIITSHENNMGLAKNNSLVTQVAQQGLEAFRMKLAEVTKTSVQKLNMDTRLSGGLVRAVPQQQMNS
mmetsp:Transcript_51741/g.123144  ORF Transcript_51741/g.123144 Transcript_51741/m.123144 type:complete len:472 (-) Transcript_51741:363-1778(-)|eukprot:CAMPEP_0178434322 /NCGR_PEP_ID=MMETSP0689_2-20121128/33364_1 /TAXON_ID=160604 /ORGANISM="Amphidinium massartii, Strain CS-259" /LENGTH=471 /DNA_ID=CAMNT_0020056383 /DNA_START=107 /DNA_END=1522 /DNA_ORIENTATION=-